MGSYKHPDYHVDGNPLHYFLAHNGGFWVRCLLYAGVFLAVCLIIESLY